MTAVAVRAGTTNRLGYRPGLDGVRGFAVVLVLALHWWPTSFPGGFIGVDLFFVLSGFLITTLLIDENARTGTVSLKRFYERRARRLFPALSVLLAVCVTLPSAWMALYLANWARIDGHLIGGPLEHTWSLAIEEQFYLVWPLVFLALRRSSRAPLFVALAIVAVMFHRLTVDPTWAVNGFDARADGLLIGCLAAYLRPALGEWRGWRLVALGSAGLLAWWTMIGIDPVRFGYTLVALACVPLLYAGAQVTAGPLTSAPMRRLGVLSYSLYLWHYPVTWWLRGGDMHNSSAATTALAVGLSAVVAVASWRFVEMPLRRLGTDPVHRERAHDVLDVAARPVVVFNLER